MVKRKTKLYGKKVKKGGKFIHHSKAKHRLPGSSKKGSDKNNDTEEEHWSKSKKKRMRKKKFEEKKQQQSVLLENNNDDNNSEEKIEKTSINNNNNISTTTTTTNTNISIGSGKKRQSKLQQSFLSRLSGSRFRELNEDLYTTTSKSAYQKYSKQPELYEQYHEGFRCQVKEWPMNPVDIIADWLLHNKRSKKDNKNDTVIVADFGCGDATLAKKLTNTNDFLVHSFDLVASCDIVTACDMANVPLPNDSVDVAVFCLSLMGTNLADFIREAHRVLKPATGILKIAEVRSRFFSNNHNNNDDDDDEDTVLSNFLQVLSKLGFKCIQKDDESNKMFILLEFIPNKRRPDRKLEYTAKP
eukprot:CAMPEP_0194175516 /NCGR_PEP_ID=MMETSP0154-20130528/9528_1 /TAXON_ID=1049557 /ORGANISM="Thalassiothrix antarctica, Strain L6-D1" /LENGTH=356 /DNA_ID=CAMNT_0038889329 /DNA_START=103 /DNA_END=1169 /DNA_ORIENTATION=-